MQKAYMIFDMQYGSTGKGLLAGFLAEQNKPDVVVTAWGPNAGHTYIDAKGRKFVHRMLANGVVSPNLEIILIGPGSVIDLEVLRSEIASCSDILQGKTLIIHPNAAVVLPSHVNAEKILTKIGSTMKGTGEAVIQRIRRNPDDMNTAEHSIPAWWADDIYNYGVDVHVSARLYRLAISKARILQIEGAQGFSLSIYHGQYPYCTSRDVTPHQVMADCAIPFRINPEVYGTLRTMPIRVANRYDADGKEIGTSGPCYPDQQELNWSDLGITPELTTVTKLPRRIFSFSFYQLDEASNMCSPDKIFLNFANYINEDGKLASLITKIEAITGAKVVWLGFGPTVNDISTEWELV